MTIFVRDKKNRTKLSFILIQQLTFKSMAEIRSLEVLIQSLKNADAEDYIKLAKNMNIPVSDFSKYEYWKDEGYSRNCIVKTNAFELILICWNKNDSTSIHGHNNQKCWVYQVDGKMTEIRYKKNDQEKLIEYNRKELIPGSLCYMHDSMGYHLLENPTDQNAMTLHLYIKPVNSCEVYNSESNSFKNKTLKYDTVKGKQI